MSATKELGGIKTIIGASFSVGDALNSVFGEAFPNAFKHVDKFKKSMKDAGGGVKGFTTALSGLSTTAKATMGTLTALLAVAAIIKGIDWALDKKYDNIDETIEKKDDIVENISEINSALEDVDNQIAELESKKLNITDSSDISTLNTQIELLKQRKKLLEWKAKNEQKENEKKADDLIEETKNDSVYNGASYMDKEFN